MEEKRPYSSAKKMFFVVLYFAYYVAGYGYLNHINAERGINHTLAFPFEESIPLVPEFVFGYFLVVLVVVIAVLAIDSMKLLKQSLIAFFLLTTISLVIFYIFPVKMVWRPEILPSSSISYKVLTFTYWIDEPYNLFPSLHVSTAFLASWISYRVHRLTGVLCLIASFIVAVSVVLVKQHYIADVVGGLILSTLLAYTFVLSRPK